MKLTLLLLPALVAAGCSGGGAVTRRVSPDGVKGVCCVVSDGADRVAYLIGSVSGVGSTGELHVAASDGGDVKVASNIAPGAYQFTPRGATPGLFYSQLTTSGNDASLNWLSLASKGRAPVQLFKGGMRVQPVGTSGNYTVPLAQLGFFTPTGKFFVVGVLADGIANSPDLHTIDTASGKDVFVRPNGAFDYLEVALSDDTLLFQDSVGGNTGVSGPPSVQTLFWVSLTNLGGGPTALDTRTANIQVAGDGKTVVYQKVDRSLWVWDASQRPASATKIADGAIAFGVGGGAKGPVAFISADYSVKVVGTDGSMMASTPPKAADPFSILIVSGDGNDVYFFQNVETQNARGTLMHAGASAGTVVKVADNASLFDLKVVSGGLVLLQNVDALGQFGDAVSANRDGSAPVMLGSKVPVGGLGVANPSKWQATFLTGATSDKTKKFVDIAAPAPVGALAFSQMGGATVTLDPTVRAGQFAIGDDANNVVYIGGSMFDMGVNNYVGDLKHAPTAMPQTSATVLSGATEIGAVVKNAFFAAAPKNSTPGIYYIKF